MYTSIHYYFGAKRYGFATLRTGTLTKLLHC